MNVLYILFGNHRAKKKKSGIIFLLNVTNRPKTKRERAKQHSNYRSWYNAKRNEINCRKSCAMLMATKKKTKTKSKTQFHYNDIFWIRFRFALACCFISLRFFLSLCFAWGLCFRRSFRFVSFSRASIWRIWQSFLHSHAQISKSVAFYFCNTFPASLYIFVQLCAMFNNAQFVCAVFAFLLISS